MLIIWPVIAYGWVKEAYLLLLLWTYEHWSHRLGFSRTNNIIIATFLISRLLLPTEVFPPSSLVRDSWYPSSICLSKSANGLRIIPWSPYKHMTCKSLLFFLYFPFTLLSLVRIVYPLSLFTKKVPKIALKFQFSNCYLSLSICIHCRCSWTI